MSGRKPNRQNRGKGGAQRANNNKIYAYPLPLVFAPVESPSQRLLAFLGLSSGIRVLNPHCTGVFDRDTKSVWVIDTADAQKLWRGGFFGKGNLSRSEPSWLARQINARKLAGKGLTSEQVTAKRRAERQQFKIDRAKAMAAVAAEAEKAFEEGREYDLEAAKASIPSAATWKPSTNAVGSSDADAAPVLAEAMETGIKESPEESVIDDEPIEDLEHLQLTLPEAFFLSWALDCLTIIDSTKLEPLSLSDIYMSFHEAHIDVPSPPDTKPPLRPDNPFLLHYVLYHHYRSLGWVVKGGIKFCVDYLLYKRGPVFHHAEFALVLCPVYEAPADRSSSPFTLQNVDPFEWSWLSTINRVNSQVHKTLILVYVTIPALSRLDPEVLRSPAVLAHYSIREVTIRRFIPARMRD
ncbi:hypothetical protein PUNSTDRAFT_73149 [Punctularia strigosozonata HHB-11173 SS5]|uniref:uncharacterized protein n=1 Tax=Punctularia strigosozonata (strain HHB-11173) TaxID=741275 RepID=UPI000441844C|nr:uncharacterized protein PUNSTDRAFT_73149 [Punctularia strigosozonata HHB-11173 SS5]EIN06185.1 hypothetical protein PUNSTDRAFT_73149 [Punctularia strigosozonata HHB-11173 SS5]